MLQQNLATHPELRGRRRGLPNVIRLHGADGHDRIGALLDRIRHHELELARLISACRQPGAIVALDVDAGTAEMRRQIRQVFEGRWQMREGDAREAG